MNSPAKILVVDDEMGIREGCKRALVTEGYAIDLAEDGTVGLQKILDRRAFRQEFGIRKN